MSDHFIRRGYLMAAHGELFANITTAVLGHIGMPYDGRSIVPIAAGINSEIEGTYHSKELSSYLDSGMVYECIMKLRDTESGLLVEGVKSMRHIAKPNPDEKRTIKATMDAAELLAKYRDARTSASIDLTLHDLQGVERVDKTTPDTVNLSFVAEDQRILLTTRDGRKVDIEMQDGDLRVMAYENENGKEAPVVTIMPRDGEIRTDREDYDREARFEMDAPEL